MTLSSVKTGEGCKIVKKTTAGDLVSGDKILLFDGLGGRAQIGRVGVDDSVWVAYEDDSQYTQVLVIKPTHPVFKVIGEG